MKKILLFCIAFSMFIIQTNLIAQQTIWVSPYGFAAEDNNVIIKTIGGAIDVTSRVTGDFQWVKLGLNLSNNQMLDSVIINYQLVNAASFISQSRISTSKLIQQSVLTDDGTDLLSTTPDIYKFFVGHQVDGLFTLALRLNFADPGDVIYIGAVGLVVSQSTTSANDEPQLGINRSFKLEQNYPNPFNPSTHINYSVAGQGNVKINIFDSNGELVRSLLNNEQSSGGHSVIWNGKDNNGSLVASGVYYYQVQVDNFAEAKKMIMLK